MAKKIDEEFVTNYLVPLIKTGRAKVDYNDPNIIKTNTVVVKCNDEYRSEIGMSVDAWNRIRKKAMGLIK